MADTNLTVVSNGARDAECLQTFTDYFSDVSSVKFIYRADSI